MFRYRLDDGPSTMGWFQYGRMDFRVVVRRFDEKKIVIKILGTFKPKTSHFLKTYGLWIGQGSQSVVIFLSRCVPKSQIDGTAVDHHICWIVVKHRRDIFAGKSIGGVTDEQTRFAWKNDKNHYEDESLNEKKIVLFNFLISS